MKLFVLFILVLLFQKSFSQSPVVGRDTFSNVIVHKDPRFDELAAKQAEINRKAFFSGPRRRNGYRVQVANTQNRDEANAVKAELLRRFPEEKSYLLYQSPNFRVRIGNFLTQKDAMQLRKLVSALYPQKGIYIVPDVVEYTPTEIENESQE